MKVAMVGSHASSGGAGRMAATLVMALNSSDHIDAILYHAGDSCRRLPLAGMRRIGSRQLNALLTRLGGATQVFDMGFARDVGLACLQADVVHLHNLHGYYLDWPHLLELLCEKPIVWTWHDMWGATGRCGFANGCDGWKSGCITCPHLEYYPQAWYDRAQVEFKAKTRIRDTMKRLLIVTPSSWLRDIAIERGYSPDRVFVVPNPVDLQGYMMMPKAQARATLGIEPDLRYALFVAADCENRLKGYDDFLLTLHDAGWRGLVAGGRPRHIPSTVRYLGASSDPRQLSTWYSAADALLVPSKFDNYPNTVLEAMACGTPVFAYAVGGIPSQMHPTVGGVVLAGNFSALASILRAQLGSTGKTDAIGRVVREFAEQEWGAAGIADQYIGLYENALTL